MNEDLFLEVFLRMNEEELINMASSNKYFNSFINNNKFWHTKILHDYGNILDYPFYDSKIDWHNEYHTFSNVGGVGYSSFGQLGVGANKALIRCKFERLYNIKATQIVCNENHSLILDDDSNVWVCGKNSGQFGIGDLQYDFPVKITNIKGKFIATGKDCSAIIDLENNLWVTGKNTNGKLDKLSFDTLQFDIFKMVKNIKAKYISLGGLHSMIIDMEDNVICMGSNSSGQLGLGNVTQKHKSYQTPLFNYLRISNNEYYNKVMLPEIKAKNVACGVNHSMIIDHDDNVYVMGDNLYKQLGYEIWEKILTPTLLPNIKAHSIHCADYCSAIIDIYGKVYVMGLNTNGRLAIPEQKSGSSIKLSKINDVPPAKTLSIGNMNISIIDRDYNVWVCGDNTYMQLGLCNDRHMQIKPTKLDDIKAKTVSCGYSHTLFIQ